MSPCGNSDPLCLFAALIFIVIGLLPYLIPVGFGVLGATFLIRRRKKS